MAGLRISRDPMSIGTHAERPKCKRGAFMTRYERRRHINQDARVIDLPVCASDSDHPGQGQAVSPPDRRSAPRRFFARIGGWIRSYLEFYGQLGVPLPGPFFGAAVFYSNPTLYRQLAARARDAGLARGNVGPLATGAMSRDDRIKESSFARMGRTA